MQVAGVFLGMSRRDACAAANKNNFVLMQSGPEDLSFVPCRNYRYCFLAGAQGRSDDVSVEFGKTDDVVQIDLDVRPPEYRGRVLRELKGRTYGFFHAAYTDGLRLDLFGPEGRRELVDGRFGSTYKDARYVYAKRGIAITVSPRQPLIDPVPELVTLSLIPPVDTVR